MGRTRLESFIFIVVGAFFFWMIKGFKGKFDDEMTRVNESSTKDLRNFITGLIIIIGITYLLFS